MVYNLDRFVEGCIKLAEWSPTPGQTPVPSSSIGATLQVEFPEGK